MVFNGTNLINHLNTMDALDTYVMKINSVKHQISGEDIDNRIIYIDKIIS